MLKKTVTYTDFGGQEVTEDLFFNLSKAELIELEMSYRGGFGAHLSGIIERNSTPEIMKAFKDLLLMSYGVRSEDGKRFIKNEQLREEFLSSEVYSELYMELVTDADAAAEFFNSIVPQNLEAEIEKIQARQARQANRTTSPSVSTIGPRKLTEAEVRDMHPEELKSGLAAGKYVL